MRQYFFIEVKDGQGRYKYFWSYSRNARKHLRNNVPKHEIGARCVVYKFGADGGAVSACAYFEDGTTRCIGW